jgi:hypothetical protein
MTPVDELTELYNQWRVLTEQEGAAINRSAWLEVDQCQAAKARLQGRIEDLSRRMEVAVHESRFRPVLDGLIALEHRNAAVLRQRRSEADATVGDCDRSCRSLRQLQRLYIPRAPQNWQSYS